MAEENNQELDILVAEDSFKKLLNRLPGIFYLYEHINDDFYLKVWNKHHEEVTEYTAKEHYNMKPYDFIPSVDKDLIYETCRKLMKIEKVQVKSAIRSKSGIDTPYFFEGYAFSSNGREFFMGVGIDLSNYSVMERELEESKQILEKLEKERIIRNLNTQNKELLIFSVEIAENNKLKKAIRKQIEEIEKLNTKEEIQQALFKLKSSIDADTMDDAKWNAFKYRFKNIYHNFFDSLSHKHPTLTDSDLLFCAYIKLNMPTEQISSLLNISKMGIKKRRYRLRKKLLLNEKDSLNHYISSF